jgi:predicted transcriptional regulator
MLILINILIIFFIILISYQIILANNVFISEGFESNEDYQPYTNNKDSAMILAQQNAGNIEFLKQQIDSVLGLNKEVQDISGNVVDLQDQVNQLIMAQQQYTDQMTGGTAPDVSGIDNTEVDSTSFVTNDE